MEKPQQRTRRRSDQMFPLVERYKSGDQSKKDFCIQHGLSVGTFQYWLKKYREEHSAEEKNSFQKITVLPESDKSRHTIRHILISTPSGLEIKIPLD